MFHLALESSLNHSSFIKLLPNSSTSAAWVSLFLVPDCIMAPMLLLPPNIGIPYSSHLIEHALFFILIIHVDPYLWTLGTCIFYGWL
jgi:hypothetical protein